VWGSADSAVDPASATPLRRNFFDCDTVVFDGVGHLPYEEVPEQFNAALTAFLIKALPRS